MESVPCTLSPAQVRKLKKASTIQLSADQIAMGKQHPHALVLHHENAKKVKRAAKNKRGVRLSLSHPEIEGSGFLDDAWDTIKSIGSTALGPIKEVYQAVAPVARAVLPYAKPLISEYTGVPESAIDTAADISKKVFGAGKRGKKAKQMPSADITITAAKPVFSPAPLPLSANPIGGKMPRAVRGTGAANMGGLIGPSGSFKPAGGAMMGYGKRGRGRGRK
jgi:hypothetical protein